MSAGDITGICVAIGVVAAAFISMGVAVAIVIVQGDDIDERSDE